MDKRIQAQIFSFLDGLEKYPSPQSVGQSLQGQLKGLWRYRIGDYRLICEIQHPKMIILILGIGHRRDVYTKH